MPTHDLIVIGAGMAGINAVGRAVGDGRRIALIERGMFGGTCPTRGCMALTSRQCFWSFCRQSKLFSPSGNLPPPRDLRAMSQMGFA